MPTPLVYSDLAQRIFRPDMPAARRHSAIDLLYITDRAPLAGPDGSLPYGEDRARSVAFGSAIVDLGPDLSWTDLVEQSHRSKRTRDIVLELGRTQELGRFPREPYQVEIAGQRVVRSPATLARHKQTKKHLYQELDRRLRNTPNGEVMLYVHGFNETFASAAFTAGELCHFLGREYVCAFFTWPASASGNPLISYTATTESAAFAVAHLKKTIHMIGRMPEVKAVHLLAHSRGAALLLDAVSQLGIEYQVAGSEPFAELSIRNIVLISPDIDTDVAAQRIGATLSDPESVPNWSIPRSGAGPDFRMTIYASPQDRALLLSRMLFRSYRRVGRFSPGDMPEEVQSFFAKWGRLDFIVYEGYKTDAFGHSFFATNPVVSSDLVQLIRFGKQPGDPERALRRAGPVTWVFEEPQ
jgi:esterase/lipase superfamily enzyme